MEMMSKDEGSSCSEVQPSDLLLSCSSECSALQPVNQPPNPPRVQALLSKHRPHLLSTSAITCTCCPDQDPQVDSVFEEAFCDNVAILIS